MSKVPPIPDAYRAAVPMLSVSDAAKAISFYEQAFGASEMFRLVDKAGKVAHAEIKIGDALVMLADPHPEESIPPEVLGGTPVLIHLFVEDVDTLFERATAAGAKIVRPIEDQFIGTRNGKLQDPFGHIWLIQTQKERISHAEIIQRFEKMNE